MSSPEDKWVWNDQEEDAAERLPRVEPSPPPPRPPAPPEKAQPEKASAESQESSPGLSKPEPKPAPPIETSLFEPAPPPPQDAALLASLWTEVDLKSWGKKPPPQAPPDFSALWRDSGAVPPVEIPELAKLWTPPIEDPVAPIDLTPVEAPAPPPAAEVAPPAAPAKPVQPPIQKTAPTTSAAAPPPPAPAAPPPAPPAPTTAEPAPLAARKKERAPRVIVMPIRTGAAPAEPIAKPEPPATKPEPVKAEPAAKPAAKTEPKPAETKPAAAAPPPVQAAPAPAVPAAKTEPEKPAPAKPKRSPALVNAIMLHLDGKVAEAAGVATAALPGEPDNLDLHAAAGHFNFELGQFEQASTHFRYVLERAASNARCRFGLAVCLERLGRAADAHTEFTKALELNPNDNDARLGMATALLRLAKPADALAIFEQCIAGKLVKRSANAALFGKAAALHLLGRIEEADAAYRAFLEPQPNSEDALASLVATSTQLGRAAEAETRAAQLAALSPKSPAAVRALAAFYLERQNYEASLPLCEKLAEITPGDFETWFNLGVAAQSLGRHERAAAAFAEALRFRADSVDAIAGRAQSLDADGDLAGARRAWRAASDLAPANFDILRSLANITERLGDAAETRKLLGQLAREAAFAAEASCRLGFLHLQAGEFDDGRAALESCVALKPDWPPAQLATVRLNLALAMWKTGDTAAALPVFDALAAAEPPSVEALHALAQIAIEREDYDGARKILHRLIDLGEQSPDLFYNTGLIYHQNGQTEDAGIYYLQALDEHPNMNEALERLGQISHVFGKMEDARNYWRLAREVNAEAPPAAPPAAKTPIARSRR